MLFTRLALALAAISAVAALPIRLPHSTLHIAQRDDAATPDNTTSPILVGTAANNATDGATNSTSVNDDAPIPQSGTNKAIFAHMMCGNVYSFTKETWKSDIALAQSAGIDGFALNIGSDDWQPARVDDAYAAAQELGTDFKLFFSFDMTVLPGNSAADGAALQERIKKYANHPNQFKYNGKSFASTFAGETSTFGHGSAAEGWQAEFVKPLADSGNAVWFVPSLFIDPATITSTWGQTVNGMFPWNGGWPVAITSQSLNIGGQMGALVASVTDQVKNLVGSIAPDQPFIEALKGAISTITASTSRAAAALPDNSGMTFMASIAPAFFTHYGPDSWNKNWLYVSDDHLYSSRWETLIQHRATVDFVEIITWNDYGESSYIGPIGADQPKSNAWVDGYDHTAWLALTKYYATAFKTGSYPTIEKDSVVLAARPHTKGAQATNDNVGKPTNWEAVQDKFWADFLLTEPATVVLSTSDSQSTTFQANGGAARFSMPLTVGQSMSAKVIRNGQTVLECKPENFTFVDNPETYNYNSFVFGCEAK